MRTAARVFLVLVSISTAGLGCGLLEKLKKKGADAGDATEPATAEPAASVAPSAEPTASAAPAAETIKPEDLKLPGACVDPAADAKKRAPNHEATVDESQDLDGDGKKDRIYSAKVQARTWLALYVMRGKCGHYVGEIPASDSWKVGGSRSKGLRTFESTIVDPCTAACGCVSHVTPVAFNGTLYISGKAKDVVDKPCGDAGAPVDAGAAALVDAGAPKDAGATKDAGPVKLGPLKVGDKIHVDWKGSSYPSTVIAVAGKDKYKIHYDGWGNEWDEVVGPDRILGRR